MDSWISIEYGYEGYFLSTDSFVGGQWMYIWIWGSFARQNPPHYHRIDYIFLNREGSKAVI